MRRLIIIATLAALAIAFSLFMMSRLSAHSWYEWDCCSGQDCWPVADEEVEEIRDGWQHLPTGAEFRNEGPVVRIRPSRDRRFHVCVQSSSLKGLCIYVRQGM